jgi:GntR family transcriptional regulator, transcriptional repressor for pyruvate dehydrogenase complex
VSEGARALNGDAFQRVRQLKTSERVARQIVNHIVDMGLEEGTVLPNEKQLALSFNVGRTTLREALRLLETRGVITIRSGPHGGPVVRRPRADDLQEGLSLILQFNGSSLLDVLEARSALEPMAARLAAERMTQDHLEQLEDSINRMRQNANDHEVFLRENQRFHSVLAESTGSHILLVFNGTLKTIADGAVLGVEYTVRRRQSVALAHERVLDALRSRDPEAAEAAMRAHVGEAGDYWRRKYPSLVNRPVRWVE